MLTGIGPIKQAFVRALRNISDLKSAVGSDGIHEGSVIHGTSYPYISYSVRPTRLIRQFGSEAVRETTIDVWAVSDDQVEAHNLDRLMLDGLEDAALDFAGTVPSGYEPSTLLCHRVGDLSYGDLDDASNKVYQVGGVYRIWTDRI